jgi:eukaryotic-like serine/threonine-protein kinase
VPFGLKHYTEAVIDFHQADVRADIYGLGATFYFLLTGRPPLPEGSAIEKLQWLQKQRPASISQYRQDVPPALIAIVEKMMAKSPGKRYPTPAAVATVLSKWTVSPIPPPTVQELSGAKPKLSAAPARRVKAESMTVQGASLSTAPTRRHLSLPVRWRLTLSYLLLVIPIGLLVWLIYRLVGLP